MRDGDMKAENRDSLKGFILALSCYIIWGFLPIYMKAVGHISPIEVVAHRILWSLPIAGIVLVALAQVDDLKRAFRTPSMLAMAALTAALISVNWSIYVWAIGSGHALDAAIGYFINPLFSVFLGAIVLKERLSRTQIIALVMTVIAVIILTVDAGRPPLVALGLTASWGFYAFFRKTLPIGPNQGFLLEVLLLAPFAIVYLLYLAFTGQGHFITSGLSDSLLLAASGVITAVPLILYANGAKLLRLSTIGVMQYLTPTMVFLLAVLVFGEKFNTAKAIAFPLIWAALIVFSVPMLIKAARK